MVEIQNLYIKLELEFLERERERVEISTFRRKYSRFGRSLVIIGERLTERVERE